MMTILLGIALMGMFVLLMSLGLLFKGRPIEGTCASKSRVLAEDGVTCTVCGRDVGTCENDLPAVNKA